MSSREENVQLARQCLREAAGKTLAQGVEWVGFKPAGSLQIKPTRPKPNACSATKIKTHLTQPDFTVPVSPKTKALNTLPKMGSLGGAEVGVQVLSEIMEMQGMTVQIYSEPDLTNDNMWNSLVITCRGKISNE